MISPVHDLFNFLPISQTSVWVVAQKVNDVASVCLTTRNVESAQGQGKPESVQIIGTQSLHIAQTC